MSRTHQLLLISSAAAAVLTFLSFLPALQNGFVNWDDASNFLNNPNYRGLSWDHLRWMFSSFHLGIYTPLSWLSFSLDYFIWGMNPMGYHLTSLLLHSLNAALFVFIMYELFNPQGHSNANDAQAALGSSLFAALLFSIHPLRVESVAWVTERRDVLSGFFFLWTILFYVKVSHSSYSSASQKLRRLSYVTYFLSLTAKATGVTLPLLMWVLDFAMHRTSLRRIFSISSIGALKKQLPYFLISLPFILLAFFGQNQSSAMAPINVLSVPARLIVTIHSFFFYIYKTAWPHALSPFYDIPEMVLFGTWGLASLSVIALFGSFFLLIQLGPFALLSFLWYVISLLPTSGLFQTGFQWAADRYSYVPCMSWAALFGAALFHFSKKSILARSGVVLLAMCLMSLSWQQTKIWHDSVSLWTQALRVAPDSPMAHNMLGRALLERGHPEEAIFHFQQALATPFTALTAHNNLGAALASEGRLEEALPYFQYVLKYQPNDPTAQVNYEKTLSLLRSSKQ